MTYEAMQILKAAKETYNRSMSYYHMWERETDEEMKAIYSNRWNEYDGMTEAYKHAYKILTGEKLTDIMLMN